MRTFLFIPWLTGVLLLLSLSHAAHAGIDNPVIKILNGSLGQIATGASITVEDAKFFDPLYNGKLVKPYGVKSLITVEVNEDLRMVLPSYFSATITLRITCLKNDGVTTTTIDRPFTVNYSADSIYANKSTFIIDNAVRVKVEVLSLQPASGSMYNFFKITNYLQSFPQYHFSCSANAIQTVYDSAWAANTDKDELPVYWTPETGADEYDLEWTYIDSSALASGRYGSDPAHPIADLLFDNNASRVTITGSLYKIPLVYDNKGHLFYRVRSVQWQAGGGRNEANWSSMYTTGLGRFNYNGHERPLNWQATTTFAEDGKRKTVVQYYDGSLRARQTVTKDNTTNHTIVAESFYDYQGRPVIQVLPAPTLNSIIKYSKGFNTGVNAPIYDKPEYDTLHDPSLYCNTGAAPMDTLSGASQYYSSNNPLRNEGYHQYIPDAKRYPFTEVEYTQDNTGRISRQSGVGEEFRIGSGHETKYFYGSADQRELDALFGTEVGHESHYFKTMVRDANGQYSVSYTDMRGRTIATALAGVPDSVRLDTLSSYTGLTRTERLSDPSSTIIKDLVMESKKSLLVSKAGPHAFTYQLNPKTLQQEGCNANICYECLYDLQITITDDCNNQKLGGQAYDTIVRNFSIGAIDTSCSSNSGGFSFSFTKFLEKGNYEVTKQLSVSRYAMDYYRDSIFMPANTCETLDDFIQQQRELLALVQQCQPSCQSCKDSLGTWDSFWLRFRQRAGIADADTADYRSMAQEAYVAAQADCQDLCENTTEYNDIRRAMLMDMTPSSGQYANLDNADDVYSIFYADQDPDKAPDTVTRYRQVTNFLDENGNPDQVFDEGAGIQVSPNKLSPELFAQKFNRSWAEALLPYHPEYNKLVKYEMLNASHRWDRRFEAVDTYAEARQKGYLNPTQSVNLPFAGFNGSGVHDVDSLAILLNYNFRNGLELGMLQYRPVTNTGDVSLWSVASITAMCKGKDVACFNIYKQTGNAFNAGTMCEAELNMAWRAFRQMYLNLKRKLINDWIKNTCTGCLTTAAIVSSGHSPHFSDAEELLAATGNNLSQDTTQAKNQALQKQSEYYDANCKAYANQWWHQLRPCRFSQADSARIISRLVQICREGADADHPYGASSVKPSSNYSFKSFESFFEHYCDSVGIDINAGCNVYFIPAPKPYDQQVASSNKPVYRPDSCECATISKYYNQFRGATGYSSFSNYLQQVYKTTISDSALNLLLNMCSIGGGSPANCSWFNQPLMLPPAFQCNTGDICVSCSAYKSLDRTFRNKFPGIRPAVSDSVITDSAQLSWNNMYEQFLNYRLGFTKTVSDYLAFAAQCNINWSRTSCDSLQQLLTDFKLYNRQNNGVTIKFSTQELEYFSDLHDLIHDGHIQLPDTIRARGGGWYNNVAVTANAGKYFCWSNGYTIEYRLKFLQDLLSGHVFYMNASNFALVVTRYATAFTVNGITYSPGVYLSSFQGDYGNKYGYDNSEYSLFTFALMSSDPETLLNFNNIKVRIAKSDYRIYFNNNLVQLIPRDSTKPISNGNSSGLGLRGRHGAVDWIKFYDGNDQVRYYENFVDADNPVLPDYDYFCPPAPACQSAFIQYYNQRLGSSYTYNQIDSIYLANCSKPVDPCPGTMANRLEYLENEFNNIYYNHGIKYDANGCDTTTWKVDYGGWINNTGVAHTDIFKNGIVQFPDSLNVAPTPIGVAYDFAWKDTACIEKHFSLELKLKHPYNLVEQSNSMTFEIWFGNNPVRKYLIGFSKNDYYNAAGFIDYGTVANNRSYFNIAEFKQDYTYWRVMKFEFADSVLKFYVDGQLLKTMDFPSGIALEKWYGFGLSSRSDRNLAAAIDWVKAYDKNGNIFYQEDFNSCSNFSYFAPYIRCPKQPCTQAFTSYFNQQQGTSYTYSQINALYQSNGQSLNICPGSDPGLGCTDSSCLFQKSYGGPGTEVAYNTRKTSDCGYIMAGSTNSFGNGGTDAYLVKTDAKGNLLWSKTYGGSNEDVFFNVKQTFDGGYIAAGYTRSFHQTQREMFVVKTDAQGNVQWSKGIGQSTTNGEVAYDILQTSDSGYVLSGEYNLAPGTADWFVVRLTAAGTLSWAKRMGSTSSDDHAHILEDHDTLILVASFYAGVMGNPSSYYDLAFIKINKFTGTVMSVRSYDVNSPKTSVPTQIEKISSGYRIHILGIDAWASENQRQIVMDVRSNGDLIRVRRMPAAGNIITGPAAISSTPDGGFISSQAEFNNADIYLSKTDANGNIQWANRIKRAGNQGIYSIFPNSSGGYTGAGFDNSDMLLMKVTGLGKSGCNDSTLQYANDTVPYVIFPGNTLGYNVLINYPVDNTNIAVTGQPAATSVNDLCISGCITPELTLCGRAAPVFPPVTVVPVDNCSDSAFFIMSKAKELYKAYNDSLRHHFDSSYIARCLEAYQIEKFTVRHAVSEYHYTLYYYDQAGNLLKTIPPAGVRPNYDSLWLDSVEEARLAGATKIPDHVLPTQYRYNTLNQVVSQKSPDGGKTGFWYDRLGRLVLSRNARQLGMSSNESNFYSYTRYDYLGRITEVGQIKDTSIVTPVDALFTRNETALTNWFTKLNYYREQVTNTVYDIPYFTGPYNPQTLDQKNLRNRVSYVSYTEIPGAATAYNNASFYSYDIHGNVDTLVQDYGCGTCGNSMVYNLMNRNGNRWKKFIYQYDLISGKVNMVMYQKGWTDQWFHRYSYDAENRLTLAETSSDSMVWERDARYEYYLHGPLARTILGDQQVQGIDYAYTLQGWLKGINSTGGTIAHDIGGDGRSSHINQYTGRDAYGLTLNYFEGEYKPIANVTPFPGYSTSLGSTAYRPLYNGNISSMSTYFRKFENGAAGGPLLFNNYQYDQLNRLTGMDAYTGYNSNTNNWALTATDLFKERIAYDGNGNILKYLRNGSKTGAEALMDSLNYSYYSGTNRLQHVSDHVPDNRYGGSSFDMDIDNHTVTNNYEYDEIGNMIKDAGENITNIKWNVYGKITEITRASTGTVPITTIKYTYDAQGNRISKEFDVAGKKRYTWYVRDAQGNLMATYNAEGTNSELGDLGLSLWERYIYGSSRLGVYTYSNGVDNDNAGPGSTEFYSGSAFYRGWRQYELSNHLGNVLTTISDKKIGVSSGGSLTMPDGTIVETVGYYNSDIISANDYYPFGMTSRIALASNSQYYRYTFNGKENDWEAKGWNNQQDYGMRIYDPRLGKFLSVDPLTKGYPHYTPYSYAGNKPIRFIDLDGMEEAEITKKYLPFAKDMSLVPASYKGVSGRIVPTYYNLHGYGVNFLYFWENNIKDHPGFLDDWNKGRVLNEGKAPIFTYELKENFEKLGVPTKGLKIGDLLEHHHINQSRTAVPITRSEHDQIPVQKNESGVKISAKPGRISNMAGKTMNFVGPTADVFGILNKNPDSWGNLFGKHANVGEVYKHAETGTYYTIVSKVNSKDNTGETAVTAYFWIYARSEWDLELGKYVGTSPVGYGESYQEKQGFSMTAVYDMKGNVKSYDEKGKKAQKTME